MYGGFLIISDEGIDFAEFICAGAAESDLHRRFFVCENLALWVRTEMPPNICVSYVEIWWVRV